MFFSFCKYTSKFLKCLQRLVLPSEPWDRGRAPCWLLEQQILKYCALREFGYKEFQLGVWPARWAEASGRLCKNLDVFSCFNKKQQIFALEEIPFDTCKKSVGSKTSSLGSSGICFLACLGGQRPFSLLVPKSTRPSQSCIEQTPLSKWNINYIFSLAVSSCSQFPSVASLKGYLFLVTAQGQYFCSLIMESCSIFSLLSDKSV